MTTTHIVIIGAGPAGSTAAILLSRAGIDVTLIEQHRFPRDKVCGECLSALGIDVLRRLAIDLPVAPVEIRRTILHAPDAGAVAVGLPRPMCGISRVVLDDCLLQAARSCGARVLQPARCEQIERASLRLRDLRSNAVSTLHADWILLADGKGQPTNHLGIKAHFRDIGAPGDAISLFGVDGCYGGVAPIENGLWNLAFSVPASRVKAVGADLDALFEQLRSQSAAMQSQMLHAHRVGKWLVSPLPRFGVARRWPAQVIPIGNAAAAIEPIGGEGIGLAMRSAELAAQHLIDAHRSGTAPDLASLRGAYQQLWRVRRFACRAAAMTVSCRSVANALAARLRDDDPLIGFALRAIGKF